MPYGLRAWWIGAAGLALSCGCALAPYRYGNFHSASNDSRPREAVIEYGEPNKRLDRLAYIVGAPARLVSMNRKVNKHELSPETTAKVKAYLEKNDLTDVYVYVNHYDPADQWRRLRANTRVAPLFRYSFGVLSYVGYTLLPPRVFGGDRYNPYTNSLYLNSDVPAIVLAEAAYAKDIHSRKLPGPYAFFADLPVLSLWHDSLAVADVLGYARAEEDWDVEQQAYHVLYPRVGQQSTSFGGVFVPVWWGGPVLGLGGAAVGHVAGRTVAARRDHQRHDLAPLADSLAENVHQALSNPAHAGNEVQPAGYNDSQGGSAAQQAAYAAPPRWAPAQSGARSAPEASTLRPPQTAIERLPSP